MPGKLIPDSEVDQLLRQGLTYREVAERLRRDFNIDVKPNSITAWRRRRGEDYRRPRHEDLLPWRVKSEHTYMYIPKLLRWESRLRAGEAVHPGDQRKVELFKQRLANAFPNGGVVHYDPDTDQGWWIVERRPGIDNDIIRNPDI